MLRKILVALATVLTLKLALASAPAEARPPHFEDYPAIEVIVHDLKAPALSKGMCIEGEWCAWDFRTRLKDAAKSWGIDFNGAFTLVEWSCGTSCQSGALIDRTDGRVYGPLPVASFGYEYRADSALLIVNPHPEREGFGDDPSELPDYAWREFYVFKNGAFTLIRRDRGSWPEGEEENVSQVSE